MLVSKLVTDFPAYTFNKCDNSLIFFVISRKNVYL